MTSTNDKINKENFTDLMEPSGKVDDGVSYTLRIRFRLSSVMHLTEQAVNRVISAYDNFFSLDDGNTAKLYMGMGADFAYDGNNGNAITALKKTLEKQPNNSQAWFIIGSVHMEQQDPEAAVEAFKKARVLGHDGLELHKKMAEAYVELGNHESALKEYKLVVKLDPDSAESFFRLGVTLDKLEKFENAANAFQKAIDLSPREPAYYQSLGLTLESLNEHEKAITCIKRAVELERRRRY